MAKEQTTHRTLTPEEVARRKATMEGGDPAKAAPRPATIQTSEHGGPTESFDSRLTRVKEAIPPWAIDYDRDGYPDGIVGRSGRNLRQRALATNKQTRENMAAMAASSVANKRPGQRVGIYSLGTDSFRQDQIGYRDRLRARLTALEMLEDADEDEPVDPRVRALAFMPVRSHGSTGVPGGSPGGTSRPSHPSVRQPDRPPTSLEQAMMAPRTPTTGFQNVGAKKARIAIPIPPGPDGGGDGGIITPPPAGNVGPYGTVRRGSLGNVPAQGTQQPDGSFVVTNPFAAVEPEDETDENKSKPKTVDHAKQQAKSTEHGKSSEQARATEHTKAPEHAKPHEPAKAAEHTKPPEHGKPHEHHDKK